MLATLQAEAEGKAREAVKSEIAALKAAVEKAEHERQRLETENKELKAQLAAIKSQQTVLPTGADAAVAAAVVAPSQTTSGAQWSAQFKGTHAILSDCVLSFVLRRFRIADSQAATQENRRSG